jgi:hypothetical protein
MSAANALQQAMWRALSEDAALTGLVGEGGVRDGLAPEMRMPCVTFDGIETEDMETDGDGGEEHRVRLKVHSEANGQREAQEVMAVVKAALHDRALEMGGWRLVNLRFAKGGVERVEDTRRHEGTMVFRAVTAAA